MVFFVCEGCNETLKKNQVEKHVLKCKVCYAVICIDCNKVFPENEYLKHNTCISEAEKYQKGLFKGKVSLFIYLLSLLSLFTSFFDN